jgi:hypothetical protein
MRFLARRCVVHRSCNGQSINYYARPVASGSEKNAATIGVLAAFVASVCSASIVNDYANQAA